jgi:hypothetical protein
MAWEAIALPLGHTRTIGSHSCKKLRTHTPTNNNQEKLLGSTDAANGGTTVWALTLGNRLTIFGCALNWILHNLLCLAFHAVSFDSHLFYLSCIGFFYTKPALAGLSWVFYALVLYDTHRSSVSKRADHIFFKNSMRKSAFS